jgi:thiol-disulfide isomerase/thioredoxin
MRLTLGHIAMGAILGLILFNSGTAALAGALSPGNPWAEILLPTPAEAPIRQYLGLPDNEHFTVSQIAAEAVIVQVYSMYCPHCQREAPHVNELYALIVKQAGLHRRLKLIGVGIGNSKYGVDFYRETYGVKFPLFPDGKFKIHKQLSETRTPHFFVLKPAGSGQVEVVYDLVGGFTSPEKFLETVRNHLKGIITHLHVSDINVRPPLELIIKQLARMSPEK